MVDTITFIFEFVGTIAFAASGALVAIEKKMDILGVVILGVTTALGGGVTRDVILGNTPPAAFTNYTITTVAVVVPLFIFLPFIRNRVKNSNALFDKIMLLMDSAGLGIFSAIGIKIASETSDNPLLMVFLGVMTGVGGGVIRDVFAGKVPSIFTKHFYASASIIGSLVIVGLWNVLGIVWAMNIGAAIIFALRLFAAHFRWELPKA